MVVAFHSTVAVAELKSLLYLAPKQLGSIVGVDLADQAVVEKAFRVCIVLSSRKKESIQLTLP